MSWLQHVGCSENCCQSGALYAGAIVDLPVVLILKLTGFYGDLVVSGVIHRVFRQAGGRFVAHISISTCRNSLSGAIILIRNFQVAQIERRTEPSQWPEVRRKQRRFFSCAKRAAITTTRSRESLAGKSFESRSIAHACASTLSILKRKSSDRRRMSAFLASWQLFG